MSILILGRKGNDDFERAFNTIVSACSHKGIEVLYCEPQDLDPTQDIILSVGGDGTFLRTASKVGRLGIPILGINIGRLGFLAEGRLENIEQLLTHVLAKQYIIEQRTLLQVTSLGNDTPLYGLNEIALHKGLSSSLLEIETYVDGHYLNTYQSDGLLVATPTGSTAYALSVGGPIVAPTVEAFTLAPISPHNLSSRPVVISDQSIVKVMTRGREPDILCSVDAEHKTIPHGEITICKADFSVNLIHMESDSYYRTLRNKLMWGADTRKR